MKWQTYDTFTVLDLREMQAKDPDDRLYEVAQGIDSGNLPTEGFVVLRHAHSYESTRVITSLQPGYSRYIVFATREHAEYAAQALQQEAILWVLPMDKQTALSPVAQSKPDGGSGFGWFLAGLAIG